ncbi:MAG TPA: DNA polymerase I [Microbacteriaceae bacterium]|nr:DNA polymerase I [Microbacteriaceae bacterium]
MNESKPTLLVVDGHSLAFRAFYALPVDSFQTRDGQHTNAIHGFISMLLSILKTEKPTHVAVAFDISRYSFRTREYPEYKGTRGETPVEFIGQVPLLQEALAAMNITTLTKEDYEADDILATLATRGSEAGWNVLVVSGDRDTIQLVTEDVTLLYPASQGVAQLKRYTPEAVRERYGIEPAQYPDIAALVGETSDNLIGISKVGEKTAVKWVTQYGSLQGILDHADEITGVVGQNLREQRENAERNRRLNALIRNLELDVTLDDLEVKPIHTAAVRDVFTKLEFRTLQERVLKLAAEQASGGAGGEEPTPEPVAMVVPEVPAAPLPQQLLDEELRAWIERVSATNPDGIAICLELGESAIIAAGLATETEAVELGWQPGSADYAPLESWLASDAPKRFFDAKVQLKALLRAGIQVGGTIHDAYLASALLKPQSTERSLADWARFILREELPQGDPNQLIPVTEGPTPAVRAWYAARIWNRATELLGDSQRPVLDTIETPALPVLAAMEHRGVAVDADLLSNLSAELGGRAEQFASQAFAEIGREVNLGSPKQLQEVLFDQLGMPKTRATKTGYTTDAAALAELQETNPHPFLGLLLQHRDVTKLRQIVDTLAKSVDSTGRIHTTYGQIGAATGRLSSNDPNLQNIPVRTEDGRRIRGAFVAGDGFESLLTADYSQIEMRIMAHLSGDPGLIEAFIEGEDLHRFVGARIFGVAPEDVTSDQRAKVKAMSYGLAYGLSAFGLAKQLRISQSEAKQLMVDYFARFGAVRDYLRGVVERAKEKGYTETIFGRRRPFPDLASPNRQLRENAERAALNAPIQGAAADLMKIAMVQIEADIAAAGLSSRMLLQVHDELIFELAAGERDALERIVRERMANAASLLVPLDVQVGVGANWDAAAH